MGLLIAGLVLWSIVHLYPSLASQSRDGLVARLGNNAYRGVFAFLILTALAMIVFGWKSAVPSAVYAPPLPGSPVVSALMLAAFILFVAAQAKTNIKRVLRHPQLTGLVVWAAAHLLANGDSRSIVLFGGLGLWGLLAIILINRRDGDWQKPDAAPLSSDLKVLFISAVAFGVVLYFHQWLFGVTPIV
jgi:uncharacterized membrane protein